MSLWDMFSNLLENYVAILYILPLQKVTYIFITTSFHSNNKEEGDAFPFISV